MFAPPAYLILIPWIVLVIYLLARMQDVGFLLDRQKFIGRRRRAHSASTPSRGSSSLEKQLLPRSENSAPSLASILPPSRRHLLSSKTEETVDLEVQGLPCDETACSKKHAQCVTATGFKLDDIRSIGDFPDYAALSGVPLPTPWLEFDIKTARPRPYRPLRWAYHQTMSFAKLEPDWWLELESNYTDRIQERKALYEQYGAAILQVLPGCELAAKELMEMSIQFLCARYPQYFQHDHTTATFHNGILKTSTDLRTTPPMLFLLHNVPEEFAIVIRDPASGLYYFRGGIICSSLGWDLGTKIGLPLHAIHDPVPDYKEKMQFSMDRYFAKMPTDKPIQRGSWGLEIDAPLFMPVGDPHEQLRDAQNPAHTLDQCNLRVDWQKLRRLPLSGAIVFNFKALFTPVTEFRDEPYIPALLLKILREAKPNLMQYKNTWHTEHLVIPAMEEYAREQAATGATEASWKPHTLDEAPYYPGWEAKWYRQQKF